MVDPSAARSEAFLRLAEQRLETAYRLARAILRDSVEAQDATHDAFVQAWRKWSTLRDTTRFEPWFDRILVNTCRDRLRTARRTPRDISNEVVIAPHDHLGQALDRDLLSVAVGSLPPEQRVVIALRYYLDLPATEIADRLGIPTGTVHSRLHYALKRLHERLDDATDARAGS